MATREENIILNLPFDEAQGAAKAYDYSRGRHDATLTGANFVTGRQGNCIEFDGAGRAEIETDFVPLTSNFTLTAWIRRKQYPDGYTGAKIGVFFNCPGVNNFREAWYDVNPETWGFWAIVKNGREVSVYLDTQLVGTLNLPSNPEGFSILQDIYGTEYGYGCLDEVKIYDVALTQEEPRLTFALESMGLSHSSTPNHAIFIVKHLRYKNAIISNYSLTDFNAEIYARSPFMKSRTRHRSANTP